MATAITLKSSSTVTTTTKTENKVQPREIDTEDAGASVDLGDDRLLSLSLDAVRDAAYLDDGVVLEVSVETSEDGSTGWREVARFDRVKLGPGVTRHQRITCTADRYARARWRVAKGCSLEKGGATFGVTGTASGSVSAAEFTALANRVTALEGA